MGATVAVKLSEGHHRLMQAIGAVIAEHTKHSPMAVDEVAGILGFCTGAAIISGCKSTSNRRRMRSLAIENIDGGMHAMRRASAGTSLVMPEMH